MTARTIYRARVTLPVLGLVGVLILACGCSDTTGPTYADVSGVYMGTISGTSQGYDLDATLRLTIHQNGREISGFDYVVGTVGGVATSATGTFNGTVASGNNPSVWVVSTNQECPTVHFLFSGSYDSANRRLTMTGELYPVSQDCLRPVTYSLTLVLSK